MIVCDANLPVSLTPFSAPEAAPRKLFLPQAIAELAEASRATMPAETGDGASLLTYSVGAWKRWASTPATK
jgi:hypothetical protein